MSLAGVLVILCCTAEDKAINWKALELPLASQIKGLAILQEEGGEVSRCMAGFALHVSQFVFKFKVLILQSDCLEDCEYSVQIISTNLYKLVYLYFYLII